MGGKRTKKTAAPWLRFAQSTLVSLGAYLAGGLVLALLLTKGAVGEGAAFPVTAVWCLLSSLAGALWAVRGSPWGPLPAGLLAAGLFAFVLTVVGLSCWETLAWTGTGGALLGCALGGGVLAGLLGSRRGRSGRRRKVR